MQTMTFAAASASLANYNAVEISGSPSIRDGSQVLRLVGYAAASGAGDTATIELALVIDGERVGYFVGTATTVAQQEGTNYLCTIVFAESGTSNFDLLGCDAYSIDQIVGSVAPGGKAVWMIGVPARSGVTSITLGLATTPKV
jgi:hypothetical protein